MKALPTKVVVEMTADYHKTTVFSGETIISQRRKTMVTAGHAQADTKGDVFTDLKGKKLEDLAEAVDDISGFPSFEVAGALRNLHEEHGQA